MNNYIGQGRKRNQTLLVVEGNHEKNKLFWLIFRCFPEISIDMDNVWIYGTNIYMLYDDIIREYGENCFEEEMDIDLPFVISKKKTPETLRYKDDFTNILLVFDYERHDTNFSEKRILELQNCFMDMTDMGKLYINYPMIESYQHFKSIPDCEFEDRKVPVSLQPGKRYKELVKRESAIGWIVEFPHRLDDLLKERFEIRDEVIRRRCWQDMLEFSNLDEIEEKMETVVRELALDERRETLKYQLKDWVKRAGYAECNKTYWQYVRDLFVQIIYYNICKANCVQNGVYRIERGNYRAVFENLDFEKILEKQNDFSGVEDGYIWVLNTCVFIVADYNFSLVKGMEAWEK